MLKLESIKVALGAVVLEMKNSGMWEVARPPDSAFGTDKAFFAGRMSLEQWLRYVFVPRVEAMIENNGPWPKEKSGLGAYLVKNFDGQERLDKLIDLILELENSIIMI